MSSARKRTGTAALAVCVLAVIALSGMQQCVQCVYGLERFYDGDPIDYASGVSKAAGVVVVYRERVWDFVRDAVLDLDDIEWAIRNKEWDELRRFSARMEADADNVGARGVRLYAEQMKILSRVKRPGKLRPCLEQLHFEVKAMIEHVKSEKKFEKTAIAKPNAAPAPPAPPATASAADTAAAPAAPAPDDADAAAAAAAATPRTEL